MIGLFIVQASSKYVDITDSTVDQYIGADKPVLIKFYSPSCPHCRAMQESYEEGAGYFGDNFIFGGVDCTANSKTCNAHSINGYPTVKIFLAKDKKGTEYSGDRSADSFCDFVEEHTGIKAKRPPKLVKDLNPYTIEKAENSKCSLITFYSPSCPHCKRFLPTARSIAVAFASEDVLVGTFNCIKFHDACSNRSIDGYPTIRLFKEGKSIPFNRDRSPDSVASFINSNCGTHRGADGLLDDNFGLVEGAYQLCQEYINAPAGEKEAIKQKIAALPGTEFYMKVIARIEAKGIKTVDEAIKSMRKLLDSKNGSQKSLDGMKTRFNIFTEFEKLPTKEEVDAMSDSPEKTRLKNKLQKYPPANEEKKEL